MWTRAAALAALLIAPTAAGAAVPDGTTFLISRPPGLAPFPPSLANDSRATFESLSEDGRYVVFQSESNGLVADDDDRVTNVYWRDTEAGETELVSRATGTNGAPGNADSRGGAISDDGCIVSFETRSTNIAASDPNGSSFDTFVRNVCADTTVLVSHAPGQPSTTPAAGESIGSTIDASGQLVAFESTQAELLAGSQRLRDIYLRNTLTDSLEVVSVTNLDVTPASGFARNPSLSEDGTVVAFDDSATDMTATADTNNARDVFMRNLTADSTVRISLPAAGGNDTGESTAPRVGADGSTVAFGSDAELVTADTNTVHDVYRRASGVTTLVSRAGGGGMGDAVGNGESFVSGIEDSGDLVAFRSTATNFGGPTDGRNAAYVRGQDAGDVVAEVSHVPGQNASADAGAEGTISDDGTVALVNTGARNLLAGAADDFADVLTRPMNPATFALDGYERVDRPDGDGPFTGGVNTSGQGGQALSSDGRYGLVFSSADVLLPDPLDNTVTGIYRRDNETGEVLLVSRANGPNGAPLPDVGAAAISADGRYVAFYADGAGVPGDANGRWDVFVRDLATGTNVLASRAADGSAPGLGDDAGDGSSISISGDGSLVAFDTVAPLVAGDPGLTPDAYLRDLRAGTTALIEGAPRPDESADARVSLDGSMLAWTTSGALVPADNNTSPDVYARPRAGGAAMLVSRATGAAGAVGDSGSALPTLSADGRIVAFASFSQNLSAEDADSAAETYVRNLDAGTTLLASRADGAAGVVPNRDAVVAGISGDGERVLFITSAESLGAGLTRALSFVRDIPSSRTLLVSRANGAAGAPANGRGNGAALAAAGTCATFSTTATGLVTGGPDGEFSSVFGRAVGGPCPASAPDTSIFRGPPANSNDTTPTFEFLAPGSAAADVSFECSVDGGPFAACRTPHVLAALPEGGHSLSVRSVLRAALRDPTPAARLFTIDTTRPRLRRLRVAPRRFALSRKRTPRVAAVRRGTSFRFRLSEPGEVTLRVERKRGKRYRRVVTLTRGDLRQGANRVRFSGRVGRRIRLKPGAHRVVVRATDTAGNRSRPLRASFTVIRPAR